VTTKPLVDLTLEPLDGGWDEDKCSHSKVVAYGDGTDGRCTKCGEKGFPLVDDGDPELPKTGLVMVLVPENRDELLGRLRARNQG